MAQGPQIPSAFQSAYSFVKEPYTDTDDVESKTNLPHTYRIFKNAFKLTMRENCKIKNLHIFVHMYAFNV